MQTTTKRNTGTGRLLQVMACLVVSNCTERPVAPGERTELEKLASTSVSYSAGSNVLLVVDDSISMGDKQELFASVLARSLTTPICKTADGERVPFEESSEEGITCAIAGPRVGMITTSLAAGGNAECDDTSRASHLVPLPSGEPFLGAFGGGLDREPLEAWIRSAGEGGCGYESTLEAMYRFLIDPEPLQDGESGEVDEALLEQRADFLTPGGSLTIIILSDEDDCSVMDTEAGVGMRQDAARHRGTAACDEDPDSACCRSCGSTETEPPEGCTALADDASCRLGDLDPALDHPNVRCFDQRRRFGESYLYPLDRYVRGLTAATVINRDGDEVTNPLFADGRTADMVHVALLAGVPWPLIATAASGEDEDALQLLTAAELDDASTWDKLAGPADQRDPRLLESTTPRSGLPGPDAERWADPIISHDYDNPHLASLQNSCVFELPEPVDCEDDEWCDCSAQSWPDDSYEPLSANNPLCQSPSGNYGTVQHFAKATPPIRLLTVAREVGSLVGSICPKTLDANSESTPAYGYNAFGTALYPWLGEGGTLNTTCMSHHWPDDEEARAGCKLIERVQKRFDCELPGRKVAPEEYWDWTLPAWGGLDDFTFCEVLPVPGDPKAADSPAHACAFDLVPPEGEVGYCLIDPENGLGSADLVKMCPEDAKRRIRLVPGSLQRSDPTAESELRFVCL